MNQMKSTFFAHEPRGRIVKLRHWWMENQQVKLRPDPGRMFLNGPRAINGLANQLKGSLQLSAPQIYGSNFSVLMESNAKKTPRETKTS